MKPDLSERNALILRLCREGYTGSEIARAVTARFGAPVSRNAVIGVVKRAGLGLKGLSGRRPAAPRRAGPYDALAPADDAALLGVCTMIDQGFGDRAILNDCARARVALDLGDVADLRTVLWWLDEAAVRAAPEEVAQ